MYTLISYEGNSERRIRIEFDGELVRVWCSHVSMNNTPIILPPDHAIEIVGQVKTVSRVPYGISFPQWPDAPT